MASESPKSPAWRSSRRAAAQATWSRASLARRARSRRETSAAVVSGFIMSHGTTVAWRPSRSGLLVLPGDGPQEQVRQALRDVGQELSKAMEQAQRLARQVGEDLSRLVGDPPRKRGKARARRAHRS